MMVSSLLCRVLNRRDAAVETLLTQWSARLGVRLVLFFLPQRIDDENCFRGAATGTKNELDGHFGGPSKREPDVFICRRRGLRGILELRSKRGIIGHAFHKNAYESVKTFPAYKRLASKAQIIGT